MYKRRTSISFFEEMEELKKIKKKIIINFLGKQRLFKNK